MGNMHLPALYSRNPNYMGWSWQQRILKRHMIYVAEFSTNHEGLSYMNKQTCHYKKIGIISSVLQFLGAAYNARIHTQILTHTYTAYTHTENWMCVYACMHACMYV